MTSTRSRAYILNAGSNSAPGNPGITYPSGWTQLLWNEEWNYANTAAIDRTRWTVRDNTTQNNTYSRNFAKCVSINSGILSIRSGTDNTVDPGTKPYVSGYLDTIGKASWQYFRIEARLRMPWGADAQGYWPAFWMRPESNAGITDGEIDVMEAWYGANDVHATLWSDQSATRVKENSVLWQGTYAPDSWHVYAFEKEAGSWKLYIDNTLVKTFTASWLSGVFDNSVRWNIRLNLQISLPGKYGGEPSASTDLSNTFDCDYIRVFGR